MQTTTQYEAVRQSIIEAANAKHTQYPQYVGHWDDFKLVRVKKTIKTKLGLAFVAGEVSIAKQEGTFKDVTVYSKRNGIDTLVDVKKIDWL